MERHCCEYIDKIKILRYIKLRKQKNPTLNVKKPLETTIIENGRAGNIDRS